MRLVFSNAMLFNPPEHKVHKNAVFLLEKFEKSLYLVLTELQELNGSGLLRVTVPQDSAGIEAMLQQITLSSTKQSGGSSLQQHGPCFTIVPQFSAPVIQSSPRVTTITTTTTSTNSSNERSSTAQSVHSISVFSTPKCSTVSRSGSVTDEQDFISSSEDAQINKLHMHHCEVVPGTRTRSLSVSVTPITSTSKLLRLACEAVWKEGDAVISDADADADVDTTELMEADQDSRRLQHVVSQDFVAAPSRPKEKDSPDDEHKKKKKQSELDSACYASPESAAKRRRLSTAAVGDSVEQQDTSSAAAPMDVVATDATHSEAAAAERKKVTSAEDFKADVLNTAHCPVNFVAPLLGSQNTMTIVAELSKRMQRQYDDLFVIKLSPPQQGDDTAAVGASAAGTSTGGDESIAAAASVTGSGSKKPRGRTAVCIKRTPSMHIPGGLKDMGEECRALLASLTPDTSDPDPSIQSPVTDSRHTFLELCQFRHYQFDSLRRAKHSSLMLLHHLQHPHDKSCHPCCSHCDEVIQTLRWHCDECPNFDLCGACYAVDVAKQQQLQQQASEQQDASVTCDEMSDAATVAPARSSSSVNGSCTSDTCAHPHLLTPYRVSFY